MTDTPEENEEAPEVKVDDPVVVAILDAVAGGANPTFQDVARSIAKERAKPKDGPNLWRRYLNAVKQQAVHLAKNGRIEITRKGEAVDPKDFKGIVKMRLPQ
ncbi:MAG: DUF3253 domain-containing protein [Rhodospirillaceae bacterium]|jgi:hypothetical protein|nr:DUF3253 domain-containing protein [Rhodospirillaceae bacterium]MBT5244250.1 DUF3253 domain-containing protein [Rhodospirillaceae bacterium]MBT5561775.1 DUF3253 domain-containing protein [Rhodospirillaceae bacterium]MBT6243214.1 DUF3253 domain-containing protein [Rhodospirillaceae bacterium]MBT7136886.1 DUF3253 domain-containing protein [Rhodospirillaceae bacterium]